MDAERLSCFHVEVHPDRFGRVDVLRLHEPARRVGADRDRRKVEAAEAAANVGEVLRVAGVAGEIERELRMTHHPAAP